MKKAITIIVCIVVIAVVGGVILYKQKFLGTNSVLTNRPATAGATWKYNQNIKQPITAVSGVEKDATLGNVSTDFVSVFVPKGAFENDVTITLVNPKTVPNYASNEITPLGSPIEIITTTPVRLNDKAILSFHYDPLTVPADTSPSEIRVAYFDGVSWEYIKPVSVASDSGTIVFETFHFSLFGPSVITDKNVIAAKWAHDKAVGKTLTGQLNGTSDKVTEKIISLTLEKMNITDKETAKKIRSELYKSQSYKQISEFYGKGDPAETNKKLAMIVGKAIVENTPKLIFEGMATEVGKIPGAVASLGQAAGYAKEGNYEEAGKKIGELITEQFIIGKAGIIATKVINYEINSWKNAEVEAAFLAYKNGANAKFYGYNNDKGDFGTVWDQMRGVRRQLELEAVKKENEARREAGLPELSPSQMEDLKNTLKESFKKQFEIRVEKEAQFADEEAKLKKLVDAYTNAGFFSSTGPSGLDKGFDFETKLDVLDHFAQKMMSDTNRFILSDKNGLIMDKAISIDDIVQGARMWLSGPDGRKQYAKFLQDRFNISMYPKLTELAGSWSGKMIITAVDIPEEVKKQAAEGKKDESGCDFTIDPTQLIGKENPMAFTLQPSGDAGGNMLFESKGTTNQTIPFTYTDGVITAPLSQKGATGSIRLPISKEQTGFSSSGSLTMTFAEGKVKISASLTASKSTSDGTKSPEPTTSTPTP